MSTVTLTAWSSTSRNKTDRSNRPTHPPTVTLPPTHPLPSYQSPLLSLRQAVLHARSRQRSITSFPLDCLLQSVMARRAPSRHCRGARLCGHRITDMRWAPSRSLAQCLLLFVCRSQACTKKRRHGCAVLVARLEKGACSSESMTRLPARMSRRSFTRILQSGHIPCICTQAAARADSCDRRYCGRQFAWV